MRISANYQELLEKEINEELEWLKEEFKIFFKKNQKEYNMKDRQLSKHFINYTVSDLNFYNNENLINQLADTLKFLDTNYPGIFN